MFSEKRKQCHKTTFYVASDTPFTLKDFSIFVHYLASEQLRRVVRLSPAEINAEAANQRESLTGARAGNAQIYDYLTLKKELMHRPIKLVHCATAPFL